MTSAETLIPNEVTFWGEHAFGGDTVQPTTKSIWGLRGRGSLGQGCCGPRPAGLAFTQTPGFKFHPCPTGSCSFPTGHVSAQRAAEAESHCPRGPQGQQEKTVSPDLGSQPDLNRRPGLAQQERDPGGGTLSGGWSHRGKATCTRAEGEGARRCLLRPCSPLLPTLVSLPLFESTLSQMAREPGREACFDAQQGGEGADEI